MTEPIHLGHYSSDDSRSSVEVSNSKEFEIVHPVVVVSSYHSRHSAYNVTEEIRTPINKETSDGAKHYLPNICTSYILKLLHWAVIKVNLSAEYHKDIDQVQSVNYY